MGTHYSLLCMGTDIDCFECLVCGYIFDPEAGDPGGGIPSGVKFLSLSDDWLCPECSAGKDEFCTCGTLIRFLRKTTLTLCDSKVAFSSFLG
jgi:rubredoxin